MANFGQLILTNAGIQAQIKAQSGGPMLKFTKIGIGSGNFAGDIGSLTSLVTEEVSVGIEKAYIEDNVYIVEGTMTNEDVSASFALREVGLYIEDENGNDVLYSYANAGESYDTVPVISDGRCTKVIRIATAVSSAHEVNIVQKPSNIANNLNTTEEGFVLDARQGKVLNDKVTGLGNELAVERARIDLITTLPAGSTTGDAELQDIRVGFNGVIYDNAGTAVRGQFKDMDSYMKQITGIEVIQLNKLVNKSVSTSSGEIIASSLRVTTEDILEVRANTPIYVDLASLDIVVHSIFFYYEDGSFLYETFHQGVISDTDKVRLVFRKAVDTMDVTVDEVEKGALAYQFATKMLMREPIEDVANIEASKVAVESQSKIFDIEGTDVDFELTDTYGYIDKIGRLMEPGNTAYNYTMIPVKKGEAYQVRSVQYKNIVPYIFISDDASKFVPYTMVTDHLDPTIYDIEAYFVAPTDGTLYVNYYKRDVSVVKIKGFSTIKEEKLPLKTKYNGNVLFGKKWAVCGDSFTNGDFSNALDSDYVISDGIYAGKNKVYGYLIGNRNNMEIQHLAAGGRTIATPADGSFTNAFSNEMYKNIDADVDYITLYFGINDSHHRPGSTGSDGEDQTGIIELGTINDTNANTFYGAWNVVMQYLIEKHPYAHIGIIVSNGCETSEYPEAEIAIAKKWGIPYIDLNGDERTPMMNRSTNSSISSTARNLRTKAFSVNHGTNGHPSAKAHEYESYFIEEWLRSL